MDGAELFKQLLAFLPPLSLFFMTYHLWGKKYRREKSLIQLECFEKLEVLKSGLGWKKTQEEYDLDTNPKFFIGAKPSTMIGLWDNSSQPTATR